MGDTVKAIKSYVIAFKKGYYEPDLKAQIFEYYNNNGDLKGKSALEKIKLNWFYFFSIIILSNNSL